jgi:hypothetical protein
LSRDALRRSAGPITRRRDLEGQVRYELLPGRLIGMPIGGVRERRDGDESDPQTIKSYCDFISDLSFP